MLSYLSVPEPSWLNGPSESNPHHFVGHCVACNTDHYDASGDKPETSPCSCGAAQCCKECPTCSQCGDKVCPQCSIKFNSDGDELHVCHGCHQTYLEDLKIEPELDAIEGVEIHKQPRNRNEQVVAHLRDILNAYSAGVR